MSPATHIVAHVCVYNLVGIYLAINAGKGCSDPYFNCLRSVFHRHNFQLISHRAMLIVRDIYFPLSHIMWILVKQVATYKS